MKKNPNQSPRGKAIILLAAVPLLMGGCPEFQDEAVTALETATRGVVNAVVTLYFDQYHSN